MITIPLTNQPNQSFQTTIPLGSRNIPLGFFITWNEVAEYWQMTLTNIVTGLQYINALPLVPGRIPAQDILRQFQYWDIGNAYVVPISSTAQDVPGLEDWGVNHLLVWGP